mgnify:CR=1 FL=1
MYDQVQKLENLAKQPQNKLVTEGQIIVSDPAAGAAPEENPRAGEHTWTECQVEQLRNQVLAYKNLVAGSDGNPDDRCFDRVQLPADNWAFKQQVQH